MYIKAIFIALLIGVTGYFVYQYYFDTPTFPLPPTTEEPAASLAPQLSSDGKNITRGEEVLLSIDNDALLAFFRDPATGLCDEHNIQNTPTRYDFCTNNAVLAASAVFTEIVPSRSGNKIGFVISSTELTPDTAVGIFYPQNTTYKVHMLSNYYLGNDFVGFSPDDTYFVTKNSCFEGICGFTIYNAATLEVVQHFGNPETEPANIFLRWQNNNTIEYTVGTQTKVYTVE